MSDTVDILRAVSDHRKALRARFGVACPRCAELRPRAYPSMLLPQQRCKLDDYFDRRPELTDDDHRAADAAAEGGNHG